MSRQREWSKGTERARATTRSSGRAIPQRAGWWRRHWLWATAIAVLLLLALLGLRWGWGRQPASQARTADHQPAGAPAPTQPQRQPAAEQQAGVAQPPPTPTPAAPTSTAAPGGIAGLQTFRKLSHSHVQLPVAYAQSPPVGGEHSPVWLACGIYDQPVPSESAVHSMEHGAVWITYRPDLPAESVEGLRKLVRGHEALILSPYPDLPAPVVASGWGVQLRLDGSDDPRLPQFIEQFERGPQTPERGASCSGGSGRPSER